MFTAAAQLKSNSHRTSVLVESVEGEVLVRDKDKADRVREHFQAQFTDGAADPLPRPSPHQFKKPISTMEVASALSRLRNGRASGPDNLPGELLKYAPDEVASIIKTVINTSVRNGEDLSQVIGPGTLIPLAKPGKPRGPTTSLRPIVLLNTVRKATSLITLKRMTSDVAQHLGSIQSGFRPGRSTADVVWTQRFVAAKATRYKWECHVLGLDMSKAFDTIDRRKLLDVMSSVTGPDEVCLIHHLLYNTTISVRINSALADPFHSTVGTPQGDGLSPVLFICYLEAALQECRLSLPPRPLSDSTLPPETGYADDISFYSTSRPWLDASLPVIADGLKKWSLRVNQEKTEWIHISRSSRDWHHSKQLGSLLGEEEDLKRRISQASQAYGRMYSLWLRRQIVPAAIRLRLYNAIVLPTLLYNCETWGLPISVLTRLDTFHRRQLRALLGIRYPTIISNEDLYLRTKSRPLSEMVHHRRLRMAGHVLRMEPSTPPQLAMWNYYQRDVRGSQGRPKTTLAMSVSKSLRQLGLKLETTKDLEACRKRAEDKRAWSKLTHD